VRSQIVARNYAETLLALAQRHGGQPAVEAFERALAGMAEMVAQDARVREFMESPRVAPEARTAAIRRALGNSAPEPFMRFLAVLGDKRRLGYLGDIAAAYRDLVDTMLGRVRVQVDLAHEPDDAMRQEIASTLAGRFGRTVIPTFRVDPALIGGVVVRHGELVMDGSLRRRAAELRQRLRRVSLPAGAAAA
jgi:F-type H+-transporting ATPase subunit delta